MRHLGSGGRLTWPLIVFGWLHQAVEPPAVTPVDSVVAASEPNGSAAVTDSGSTPTPAQVAQAVRHAWSPGCCRSDASRVLQSIVLTSPGICHCLLR